MKRFTFNTIALFTIDNQKMVDFYCDKRIIKNFRDGVVCISPFASNE